MEVLFKNWISSNVSIFCQIVSFVYKGGSWLNGLIKERHISIANTLELRLSCTNPLI